MLDPKGLGCHIGDPRRPTKLAGLKGVMPASLAPEARYWHTEVQLLVPEAVLEEVLIPQLARCTISVSLAYNETTSCSRDEGMNVKSLSNVKSSDYCGTLQGLGTVQFGTAPDPCQ